MYIFIFHAIQNVESSMMQSLSTLAQDFAFIF